MVGAENGQELARHVDSSPYERTVALWNLERQCRESKCGILGRDAEKHGSERSDRLMAKWSLPRQLVAKGFASQETSVKGCEKPSALQRSASLSALRSATASPVPWDSRVLGK